MQSQSDPRRMDDKQQKQTEQVEKTEQQTK